MKYLEALDLTNNFQSNNKIKINLITSFFSNPLNIFLKAFFVKKNIDITIFNNPFNTLKQTLISLNLKKKNNVLILSPWDFCEKLNWRMGLNNKIEYFNDTKTDIDYLFNLLKNKKKNLKILYTDAPIPNNLINSRENHKLSNYINSKVSKLNCSIFPQHYFDITKFFEIGFPFKTKYISRVAENIGKTILLLNLKKKSLKKKRITTKNFELSSKKILITDFDGVLWGGIVAEDGYKKINCGNDATGYKYFLYQSFLRKLINRGVALIGVTRNRLEIAKKGFLNKDSILKNKDFVKIFATYQNKSEMVKKSYESLNLSMDSAIFIDDSLIEVSEVKKSLPKIETLIYPKNDNDFPEFIEKINNYFQKNFILTEDKIRLKNYKTKKNFNKDVKFKTRFNLNEFLSKLNMKLEINKKKLKNKNELIRPFQLINKTNQFNLNGIRLSKNNFENILKQGGKVLSGKYSDKTGDYGEIITILIDNKKNVISFVMSCRVFQRNIEFAFLYSIIKNKISLNKFNFKMTSNNLPLQNFLTKNLKKYLSKKVIFSKKREFLLDFTKEVSNFKIKFIS